MGTSAPGGAAQELLNVPSLLILIMGVLGVLFALFGLVSGGGMPAGLMDNPQITPEVREMIAKFQGMGRGGNVLSLILDGVMIYGALQMRQVKNWGLSLASAILVLLPCAGCCCLLGLPVGIWAIITLTKPEVKSAFS